ncbi:flagellin N-terminal helical domain-containing protein [Actinoplanes aureus]|uniref:Flagellin n=1 Tax=Actinoplanes aureus TaxID=2792083 RepID=A0A931G1D3_9ACTN|nr:flagellin [Actinoplanes aureus]MBG0566895.1 flagellin [Actinoplanes aureus]
MGLRINQNIAAQNAYRNLSVTDNQMAKSLEKLSSGFRINRAADDAAGLSISEGLRSQIGGLKTAVRNTQDGVSVAQTAEGSLNEVTSILQRMRDLSVQTSNSGAMDAEAKDAANKEMKQLNAELDRIGSTTSFGKAKLLDGSFGATKAITGSAGVAKDDLATATGTSATGLRAGSSFDITVVDGKTLDTPVSISFADDEIPAGATGQDIAKLVNEKISTQLKGVAGENFQGNEVSMSATTDATGATTFKLSGAGEFNVGAGGTDLLAQLNLAPAADLDSLEDISGGNTGRFQVGANANVNERIAVSIGAVNAGTLGTSALDLTTADGPNEAITVLDKAIQNVSDSRAALGAIQNRFEHTINNLNVAVENLSASESRIRDTDMAQEMVSFTRAQILTQAGTSMLSQANQSAQNVLSLLR